MWYFSWVLGLSLACAFAVMNALWLEVAPGDAPAESTNKEPGAGEFH